MGARGRKSSAELATRRPATVLVVNRPDPPTNLSVEARQEWDAVVGCLPADQFARAVHPMLEAYCNLAVSTRTIDQMIQGLDVAGDDWLSRYNKLLAMYEREARALANFGVRLGLACASRNTVAKPIQGVVNVPWQNARRQ